MNVQKLILFTAYLTAIIITLPCSLALLLPIWPSIIRFSTPPPIWAIRATHANRATCFATVKEFKFFSYGNFFKDTLSTYSAINNCWACFVTGVIFTRKRVAHPLCPTFLATESGFSILDTAGRSLDKSSAKRAWHLPGLFVMGYPSLTSASQRAKFGPAYLTCFDRIFFTTAKANRFKSGFLGGCIAIPGAFRGRFDYLKRPPAMTAQLYYPFPKLNLNLPALGGRFASIAAVYVLRGSQAARMSHKWGVAISAITSIISRILSAQDQFWQLEAWGAGCRASAGQPLIGRL